MGGGGGGEGVGVGGGPWYVAGKDTGANLIYVSHRAYREAHARDTFEVADVNWMPEAPEKRDLRVKVRHGPQMRGCRIEPGGEGRLRVTMAEADAGIAAGQFVVFYDGAYCLGGGVIEEEARWLNLKG